MSNELDAGLNQMERSARGMIRKLGECKKAVRGGEPVTAADALVWLETAQTALNGALRLVGAFKVTAAQARQSAALAAGAGALSKRLVDELGKANLTAETALGMVPEPGKRN